MLDSDDGDDAPAACFVSRAEEDALKGALAFSRRA